MNTKQKFIMVYAVLSFIGIFVEFNESVRTEIVVAYYTFICCNLSVAAYLIDKFKVIETVAKSSDRSF